MNKALPRLVLACCALFTISIICVGQDKAPPRGGRVQKEYDRFKDLTTVTFDALLAGDYPTGLSVRAAHVFSGETPTKGPDKAIFAFISTGYDLEYEISHSLIFLVDGERTAVEGPAYMKQRGGGGYVEMIMVVIPTPLLQKIVSSRKAEAQLGKTEFEFTSEQKETLKAYLLSLGPSGGSVEVSITQEPENPEATKAIKGELRSGFGMPGYTTTWYDNILNITVRATTIDVQTDSESVDYNAKSICGVVSMFVYSNTRSYPGLTGVRVYGDKGQLLIHRRKLSDPCQ